MLDPLEIPADLRVSRSPKILPIKSTNNTYNFNVSKKLKNINCRNGPLQISFWPRGRTLVRPWRISLRSLIVESMEISTGIIRPLNFTLNLISKLPLSLELPFSIFHLFSVSVFILWFSPSLAFCSGFSSLFLSGDEFGFIIETLDFLFKL